jgi:hypothetical protein
MRRRRRSTSVIGPNFPVDDRRDDGYYWRDSRGEAEDAEFQDLLSANSARERIE